tara:strand:- start:3714 stop:4223 length:510 start_codon:yes stop_codon:yes gene_type:complete
MNWQEIVKSIAPTLGTALGGPMGGAATKFIAEKLLGNPDATTGEVKNAVLWAPTEQLVKLKALDLQFERDMKALDIDVFELESKDRDSARGLYKVNIWPQIALSAIFIVGYFGILYMLFSGEVSISESQRDVVNILLGVLTAAVPQILSFWFGSSLGSKEKNSALRGEK